MNLTQLNQTKLSELKDVPGLLSCRVDYEVKSAHGRLDYTGPAIAPDHWRQMLSFFRWTHKETQSESPVRLYVSWSFTNRIGSGSTTHWRTFSASRRLTHHGAAVVGRTGPARRR